MMVFVVREATCPKCGSKGLYITQENWKPVVIKCRHVHTCGWEVDLRQFWPNKQEDFVQKGIVSAASVQKVREEIERAKKEAES